MNVIDLRASGSALIIIESRVARTLAKIEAGLLTYAEEMIKDLRRMPFEDGVSRIVRQEAQNAADALSAELNVRRVQAAE